MEVIKFSKQEELKVIFESAFARKNMIPIIGAGFTDGESAHINKVPGGDKFEDIMIENICKHCSDISRKDFEAEGYKFSQIANEFFKRVPRDEYRAILKNHFTNVKLPKYKLDFLKIRWPYIYTLNIDDAIETNSKYVPVLPYRKLSEFVSELNCVFKMHGDVLEELKYNEMPNIIFSQEQYIKSLEKNSHILKFFQSDYSANNMIFIGCSLKDELDIQYAISTSTHEIDNNTVRIYVTRDEPKELRKSRLEDFGITAILLIDNYVDFYQYLYDIYDNIRFSVLKPFDEYKNPTIQLCAKDVITNKEFLLDILGAKASEKILPYYSSQRNIARSVIKNVSNETVTVIYGKRYSGKTFIAKQLVNNLKDKDVYFFPSNVSFSVTEINDLIKIKNSYLIFDTNSIDVSNIEQLDRNIEKFHKNNSNIIVFVNKSDSLINNLASQLTNNNYYFVPNKLEDNECIEINDKLSQIGLMKLEKNRNLLDNCYRMFENYGERLPIDVSRITENEFVLTLMLASDGKIYSIAFNLFNISRAEVRFFIEKMSPLIEIQNVSNIERHQHSGFKITSNSVSWLFKLLSDYKEIKGDSKVAEYVYMIISTLVKSGLYNSIYKKIITFDNLNQVFSGSNKGAANLILKIYEKLEEVLYDDSHFWLQRAKSIQNLRRDSKPDISLAIDYAKKAYHDSDKEKLQIMATTTLALLECRLVCINKYQIEKEVKDAILWLYNALQVSLYNERYVETILENAKSKTSDIRQLSDYIIKNNSKLDRADKKRAELIINKVMELK